MDLPSLARDHPKGFGDCTLRPHNLMFGAMGVVLGTAVGVLPGLGPSVAIAILLPVTFGLDPTAAFIFLRRHLLWRPCTAARRHRSLINTPGDAASSVTTDRWVSDGAEGEGTAVWRLTAAAIGSFIERHLRGSSC